VIVTVSCVSNVVPIEALCWLCFASASSAENKRVKGCIHPLALGQVEDQTPVKAAFRRKIEVFNGSQHGELSLFDPAFDPAFGSASAFQVNQQQEAFFKSQLRILRIGALLSQGFAKSRQAQFQ